MKFEHNRRRHSGSCRLGIFGDTFRKIGSFFLLFTSVWSFEDFDLAVFAVTVVLEAKCVCYSGERATDVDWV